MKKTNHLHSKKSITKGKFWWWEGHIGFYYEAQEIRGVSEKNARKNLILKLAKDIKETPLDELVHLISEEVKQADDLSRACAYEGHGGGQKNSEYDICGETANHDTGLCDVHEELIKECETNTCDCAEDKE